MIVTSLTADISLPRQNQIQGTIGYVVIDQVRYFRGISFNLHFSSLKNDILLLFSSIRFSKKIKYAGKKATRDLNLTGNER